MLADTNVELVNCYKQIRAHPEEVGFYLGKYRQSGDSDEYYAIRKAFPERMESEQERAAAFLYLNRFCFNGLYRTNKSGKFNVPFGGGKTGRLPSLSELQLISERLKTAELRVADFAVTVSEHVNEDAFFYLDPPFSLENKRIFSQYNGHTFGKSDIERLRESLREIDARGGSFVMSYAASHEVIRYFSEWRVKRVFTQRNIAGFSANRRRAGEVMVTNMDIYV